jgi:hypothetical protein
MTLRMGITRRPRGTALTSAPRPGHEFGIAVFSAISLTIPRLVPNSRRGNRVDYMLPS